MRVRSVLLGTIMLTVALVGCTTGAQQVAPNPIEPCGSMETGFNLEEAEAFNPRVELSTSKGTIEMVLYQAQVPFTAGMFLAHVKDGYFDETRFHQLHEDVFIQGGDPNSASENRRLWGTTQYQMPNEFHEHLRHDQPGIVSIAGTQPQQGGTQFIIGLQELPGFDDKQNVFARVTDGLDVAYEISRLPTDDRDRPEDNAWLHSATSSPPPQDAEDGYIELSSYGFDCEQATEANGTAQFLIAVRNTGPLPLNGTFQTETPTQEWDVQLRNSGHPIVASGQTGTFFVDVEVPPGTEDGSYPVNVTFSEKDGNASTTRNLTVNVGSLGPATEEGSTVTIDYVGTLDDARAFDTTVPAYAQEESITWFQEPSWFEQPEERLGPIQVELGGSGLIPGLVDLIDRAQEGESVTGRLTPSEGYGADTWGESNLGGRTLAFQVHVHAE